MLGKQNETKPLQEWPLWVHDRGLVDEQRSPKTSRNILFLPRSFYLTRSLGLALLEEAADAFSDVTDSNDIS